ncbi:uncharacterized protein [Macrobrachium rosenbergii]|uniref:uncharacterized protein n=1 Tax=Macrobrachium rosenbergii TaxID=79674 RepID=UPI0034D55153
MILKLDWAPVFTKNDYDILRNAAKDENLAVPIPDKGKGAVILDRCNCVQEMNAILNDPTKFTKIGDPDLYNTTKPEDKINRFLRTLKQNKTGSSYGIMSGLPKIHKEGIPLRRILSSINASRYKLAKLLVPLLQPLTNNRYTLTNSATFKEDPDLFMASFDVESLFTNFPAAEAIDIILNKLFPSDNSLVNHFNKTQLKSLLELAVQDTAFIFDGTLFSQIEGIAMGSPLGPNFAVIFMNSLEEPAIGRCPSDSRPPLFYKWSPSWRLF